MMKVHKNHVTLQNGEGPAGILSGEEKTVCWEVVCVCVGGWREDVHGVSGHLQIS